jgi:hypothetical protein
MAACDQLCKNGETGATGRGEKCNFHVRFQMDRLNAAGNCAA